MSLLRVDRLSQHYALARDSLWRKPQTVIALDGVSFEVEPGRSLGVVGESGSGKSTLARLVMALEVPTAGSVWLQGQRLHSLSTRQMRQARREMQMVFQDPYGSLDPRQRVGRIVAEPLSILPGTDRAAQRARVDEVLEAVGLRAGDADKYPHEFSGGQRQRIAIARALVTRPKLIIADEPVSALDVSVQAQVLNLMRDLQQAYGVTYLFISHDLAVVEYLCDEVLVMQHGRVVERGAAQQVFRAPQHPYTRALLDAVPTLDA
nr:ATP-binding cassette domain-containing protein [uncultured Caldimonas sp.]